MEEELLDQKKRTGKHYTPPHLARFIAKSIWSSMEVPDSDIIRIMDPSCGDGELLKAMLEEAPRKLISRIHLYGIDQDGEAVSRARTRLESSGQNELNLTTGDFLETCIRESEDPSLFGESISLPSPDAVIANPPYVRTQVLGSKKSKKLSEIFNLNGRIDLYQAFLVAIARKLSPGAYMGIITSNRFLSTKSGSSVRELLSDNFEIKKIIDLGDTKLFDAAVLPAIVVARKSDSGTRKSEKQGEFVRIYEKENADTKSSISNSKSIYNLINKKKNGIFRVDDTNYEVSSGFINIPDSEDEPWSLLNEKEAHWIRAIKENTDLTFDDLVNVRVGIKTTADDVFIRDDWDDLPSSLRPESELLYPLLTPKNANHWQLESEESKKVLYTHYVQDGKRKAIDLDDYPRAAAYLEQNRERLAGRTYVIEAGRNWYEVWVPQDPDAWRKPKLVFPDISDRPRFVFDEGGSIVKGNCYWIALEEDQPLDLLYLLQGVANSQTMTRYHDLVFNNKLYSGRRRYLTQYVKKYPVPDPNSRGADRIIETVKAILDKPNVESQNELLCKLEEVVSEALKSSSLSQRNHLEV